MHEIPNVVRDGPLEIRARRTGTSHTLELAGELELATAPTLNAQLDAALADGADLVLVDLSGLEFIDSTGIALLVEAHNRLNENGEGTDRFLLVRSDAPAVARVMRMTELDRRLRFVDGPPS